MDFKVVGITIGTDGYLEKPPETWGSCSIEKLLKSVKDTNTLADTIVKVRFKDVSKMLMIVLRSIQEYTASQSFCEFINEDYVSGRELSLYRKWEKIFNERILELEPTFNDSMMLGMIEKRYPSSGLSVVGGRMVELEPKFDDITLAEIKDWFNTDIVEDKNLPSKLIARENAGYVLSVFNRNVVFEYTASIRQWNYIHDWCIDYCDRYYPNTDSEYAKVLAGKRGTVKIMSKKSGVEVSFFETRLYYDLLALANSIRDIMYISEFRDVRGCGFSFLASLLGVPICKYDVSCFEPNGYTGEFDYMSDAHSHQDSFGLVYNTSYTASFMHILNAERYKNLKYYMLFNPAVEHLDFFIPPMLIGTDYADDWVTDLSSIADIIPQATKVAIIEIGFIGDFLSKCEDQLCSNTQLELMNQTRLTAMRFSDAVKDMEITNPVCINYIHKFIDENTGRCKTRCSIRGRCNESCFYGASNALNRII